MNDIPLNHDRIRAALDAYSMVRHEVGDATFTNGDHRRAIEAAIAAADLVGQPQTDRVARARRKIQNAQAIAAAMKSQSEMVLDELDNVIRALGEAPPAVTDNPAVARLWSLFDIAQRLTGRQAAALIALVDHGLPWTVQLEARSYITRDLIRELLEKGLVGEGGRAEYHLTPLGEKLAGFLRPELTSTDQAVSDEKSE